MLKQILIIISILFFFSEVISQPTIEWDKTFGGSSADKLKEVVQNSDGTFILAGWSESGVSGNKTIPSRGSLDYWIIKADNSGNAIWQKTIGGNNWDYLESVNLTSDGGYILGGSSNSGISAEKTDTSRGGTDFWIVKLDTFGNLEWQKTLGGAQDERLFSISQTQDDGFIVGGWTYSGRSGDKTDTSRGGIDYWGVKLNQNGDLEWQKTIGGANDEASDNVLDADNGDALGGAPIIQTSDGGYLLGCVSNSNISGEKNENSKGGYDFWVIKLDVLGNIEWQETIGGNALDRLHSVKEFNNKYLIGGSSTSEVSGDKTEINKGDYDYWVVCLDNSGNKLWDKTIGGSDRDVFTSFMVSENNAILIGGPSMSAISGDKISSASSNDYWILKIDSLDGSIVWQKNIRGNSWDNLTSIETTIDQGYLIGGTSQSTVAFDKTTTNKGMRDYWIVKLSPDTGTLNNVWPGDANSDGIANVYDILPIAVGYNNSGFTRPNANLNWTGQIAPNWIDTFSIGVNHKHADCDGNGVIDLFDVQPIAMNYGLSHPKNRASSNENRQDPDLYFSLPTDSFNEGDTIIGTIQLGNMNAPINDIYGIAFALTYDASIVDSNSFSVDFTNAWFANPDTSIGLVKDLFGASKVDIGLARIDQANRTGYGKLADISFVIQDNIDGKDYLLQTLNLGFENVVAISADEMPINITTGKDSLLIRDYTNIANNIPNSLFKVFPNPASATLHLSWENNNQLNTLKLYDNTGRLLSLTNVTGISNTTINFQDLPKGIYFISLDNESQVFTRKISILR